jgi:hypothetical protein
MSKEIKIKLSIQTDENSSIPYNVNLGVFVEKSGGAVFELLKESTEEMINYLGVKHFYELTPEQIEELKKLLCLTN